MDLVMQGLNNVMYVGDRAFGVLLRLLPKSVAIDCVERESYRQGSGCIDRLL